MWAIVQVVLDQFYFLRKRVLNWLVFLTIRFYGVEAEYASIQNGKYESRQYRPLNLDSVQDLDILVDLSQSSAASAEKRRSVVTDKCKTLFTLGSLLLGVIGLMLPKYLAFDQGWMRILSFVAIAMLFNAIVVLLAFLDVGSDSEVVLDPSDVPLDGVNLKKSLVNRNLKCVAANENRTDYLVDLYKATRFCMFSAMTIIAALVLGSIFATQPKDLTEQVIRELRSEPNLVNLLRGPQGVVGQIGETGHEGPIGPRGEEGAPGTAPSTDEILSRLLSDARFSEAIERAVASKNPSIEPVTAPQQP